jgi:Holliday junction resolvase
MGNNNDIGAAWETEVAKYLRGRGIPAVRSRGTGFKDTGDIDGLPLFSIDCKDQERHVFFQWLRQVRNEARNARKPFGAVIIKKRDGAVPDAAVVLELSTFAMLLEYIEEVEEAAFGGQGQA